MTVWQHALWLGAYLCVGVLIASLNAVLLGSVQDRTFRRDVAEQLPYCLLVMTLLYAVLAGLVEVSLA